MPKLISWNINVPGQARSAQQLDWIALQKADVLAFQEIASASDLRQKLSEIGFEYFDPTNPVGGRNKLVAIASRKPLRRIRSFARLPHPERAISCLISLGRKEAELHCVHVPPGSIYGRIKVEFLEAVTRGLATRERPQLLVGDFNCPQVMKVDKKKIITWAQDHGKDGWYIQKTCRGVVGKQWDAAERGILCPTPDMEDAYIFVNKIVTNTYLKKAKGGPIASTT